MVWIRSCIFKDPKNQNTFSKVFLTNGLKLSKRLPKHINQALFTKASAILKQATAGNPTNSRSLEIRNRDHVGLLLPRLRIHMEWGHLCGGGEVPE